MPYDIEIAGVTYPDVPSVTFKDSGGNAVSFIIPAGTLTVTPTGTTTYDVASYKNCKVNISNANLIAGNIKNGVGIYGVTGTFSGFTKHTSGTFRGSNVSKAPLTLDAGFPPKLVIVRLTGALTVSTTSTYYYTFLYRHWAEDDDDVYDAAEFLSKSGSNARIGVTENHWERSGNTCTYTNTAIDLRFYAATYRYDIWG